MRLHNLKDAGTLLPQWAVPCLLNVAFLGLYVLAVYSYGSKPSDEVASACTAAILLSLVIATFLLVREIVVAQSGDVARAVGKGVVSALNLSWAITCLSFLCYIGWAPAADYVAGNVGVVATGVGALALVVGGSYIAFPSKTPDAPDTSKGQALTAVAGIKQSVAQMPTFQVTVADLTRLLAHQSGRAIGYAGSNVLFDDTFSLELDVNNRVGKVYSNSNLVWTAEFMYWRLHMLMMGSAAEQVLTGSSSQAALDDLTSFDELAAKYLMLGNDRTFNATPANIHEAQIKASRITMLRRSVYDRCHAACLGNQKVLTELVKLMRTRSVLTYGDIRGQLDRVEMPDGFPVARFDDNEILRKALLTHDEHVEVTLEGTFEQTNAEHESTHSATNQDAPHSTHTPERSREKAGVFIEEEAGLSSITA